MKNILFLLALLFPVAAHAQTAAYNSFCDQGGVSAVTSGLNSTNKLDGVIPYCTVTVYLDGVSQVSTATYTSGGTITGTVGQTCNATFPGGTPSGTGSIALTGTNIIAGGTSFAITPPGVGHYATAPTTATLSNGTASCSGTATVVTVLSPIKATIYKDAVNTPQTNPYQTLVNGQILFYAATGQGYDIVKSGGIPPLVYVTPLTVTDWLVPTGGGSGGVPSGDIIWPTCTANEPYFPFSNSCLPIPSPITLKVNGTDTGVDQTVQNLNGSGPAAPTNFTNCVWQNDTLGDDTCYWQPPNFGNFINAPAGNYFLIYPTTESYYTFPAVANCEAQATPPNGWEILRFNTSHGDATGCKITWSGFTPPAGYNPAHTSAIYGLFVASRSIPPTVGTPGTSLFAHCVSGSQTTGAIISSFPPFALNSFSSIMSGSASSFDFSTASCEANDADSGDPPQGYPYVQDSLPEVALVVYSSDAPPPPPLPNITLNFAAPLNYNPSSNSLGIVFPYSWGPDTGTTNLYAVSIPAYNNTQPWVGMDVYFTPLNSNTPGNPTLSLNATAPFPIFKQAGEALAAGDIDATHCSIGAASNPACVAHVVFDQSGYWELQNPQTAANLNATLLCTDPNATGPATCTTGTSFPVVEGVCINYVIAAGSGKGGNPMLLEVNGSGPYAVTRTNAGTGPTPINTAPFDIPVGQVTPMCFDGLYWEITRPTINTVYSVTPGTNVTCSPLNTNGTCVGPVTISATGGGGGLSGMTSGQVPIAASATTVTSSKTLAGSGSGITTGPTSSTNTDCAQFTGTGGQIADSGSPCGGGGGITALTVDVTASGSGSVAATAVNLPGHIALTGTPIAGQVPTATSSSAATWQTPGGGGSPFAGKTIDIACDSRCIVAHSCQVSALSDGGISSGVVSGGVLAAVESVSNTQTAGNIILLSGFTGGATGLNGQLVTVLASPAPTATTWSANVSGGAIASTGTGTYACNFALPQTLRREPLLAGATIVQTSAAGQTAANVAANFNTLYPSVTPNTTYLLTELGSDDCLGGCTPGTVETNISSIYAQAHTNNYINIGNTLIPIQYSAFSPTGNDNILGINNWQKTQSLTDKTISTGSNWDYEVNAAAALSDPQMLFNFMQPGCSTPCENQHLTDGGVQQFADAIVTGMVHNYIPDTNFNDTSAIADSNGSGAIDTRSCASSLAGPILAGVTAVCERQITLDHFASGNGDPSFEWDYSTGTHYATQMYSQKVCRGWQPSGATSLASVLMCPNTSVSNTLNLYASDASEQASATPDGNLDVNNITINGTCSGPGCATGAVSQITPGTNVTCSPNVGGHCIGSVTVNASGGGGGACMTPMQIVVSGTPTSETFSSIPATCNDLILSINGRINGGGDPYIYAQLNGDSTANHYVYANGIAIGGSFSGAHTSSTDPYGVIGLLAYSSSPAGFSGTITCDINNYLNTTFTNKSVHCTGDAMIGSGANTPGFYGFDWIPSSAAAVTSLTVIINAGSDTNIVAGSVLTLSGR